MQNTVLKICCRDTFQYYCLVELEHGPSSEPDPSSDLQGCHFPCPQEWGHENDGHHFAPQFGTNWTHESWCSSHQWCLSISKDIVSSVDLLLGTSAGWAALSLLMVVIFLWCDEQSQCCLPPTLCRGNRQTLHNFHKICNMKVGYFAPKFCKIMTGQFVEPWISQCCCAVWTKPALSALLHESWAHASCWGNFSRNNTIIRAKYCPKDLLPRHFPVLLSCGIGTWSWDVQTMKISAREM